METLTIGQLAKAAGVGVETVRFYERGGLLAAPARRESGYRQYSQDAVRRVRFIRRAKDLGSTLKEIGELLELRVDRTRSCADVRVLARTKIADVEAKIKDLARIQSALDRLARSCRGAGRTSECPILEAIDHEDPTHAKV